MNQNNQYNGQQRRASFDVQPSSTMPLCHVHAEMEDKGRLLLTFGNGCVACSLNERQEILTVLEAVVPEGATVDSVSFLASLLPTDERVEDYIRSLPWSTEAGEYEKTLVAGNLRAFVSYLRTQQQEGE